MQWTNPQQHTTQQYSNAITTTTTTIQQQQKQQQKQYNNSDNKQNPKSVAAATTTTPNTTWRWACSLTTATVNQNFPIFQNKKIDQSDSCIFFSMVTAPDMDECRNSWFVYNRNQAVLDIIAYKKIRVQWFFVYFMKMDGTKWFYNAVYIVVYIDFFNFFNINFLFWYRADSESTWNFSLDTIFSVFVCEILVDLENTTYFIC